MLLITMIFTLNSNTKLFFIIANNYMYHGRDLVLCVICIEYKINLFIVKNYPPYFWIQGSQGLPK